MGFIPLKVPPLFLKAIWNVLQVTLWMWIELFPTAAQKIHNHHNYWWHLINIQLPSYSSYSWTSHLLQPKTNALLIIFCHTKQPTCVHLHWHLRLAQWWEGRARRASTSARPQPATGSLTNAPCKPRDLLPSITQLLPLAASSSRIHKRKKEGKKPKEMPVLNIKYPLLGTITGAKGCSHPKALSAPGPTSQDSPEDQQALKIHRSLVLKDAGGYPPFPMWSTLMVWGIAVTQECSSCPGTACSWGTTLRSHQGHGHSSQNLLLSARRQWG